MSIELLVLVLVAGINAVGLIMVAVINVLGLYWIRRLEKNTNSMKDDLVALTAKSSFAAGALSETDKKQ